MSQIWQIKFFEDKDDRKPVKEFLYNSNLTDAEKKRIEIRLRYISQSGLAILGKRPDVLEKLQDPRAAGLYSLRCCNTPNNPRILICAIAPQTFFLLYGFKEKSSRDYDKAITIAIKYKQELEARCLKNKENSPPKHRDCKKRKPQRNVKPSKKDKKDRSND